jgi:hypothetical protein
VDPPNSRFLKQLLLDLQDAVKYWKRATGEAEQSLEATRMDTARLLEGSTRENERLQLQLEGATRENQRLQQELQGAVRFNEDKEAMFVAARREAEEVLVWCSTCVCRISCYFLDGLDNVSQCGVIHVVVVVAVVSRIHVGNGNLLELLWVVY